MEYDISLPECERSRDIDPEILIQDPRDMEQIQQV